MLLLKELAYQYILLHDNLTKKEKLQLGTFVKESSDEQVMSLLLTGKMKKKLQEGESEFVKKLFTMTQIPKVLNEAFDADVAGSVVRSGAGGGMKWMRILASKWASYKVPNETTDLGWGLKISAPGNIDSWADQYGSAIQAIKGGSVVGAILMAALVILVARKAYKSHFSAAAKACKGKGSKELILRCVKSFKVKAVMAEIKELQSSMKACDSTKKPDKCKKTIQKKIMKNQKKLAKIK